MSREHSELNAIENIFESKLEQIQEILGCEEIDGLLEEMIWKAAEDEFGARGGYE